jgi:hypothetical protein
MYTHGSYCMYDPSTALILTFHVERCFHLFVYFSLHSVYQPNREISMFHLQVTSRKPSPRLVFTVGSWPWGCRKIFTFWTWTRVSTDHFTLKIETANSSKMLDNQLSTIMHQQEKITSLIPRKKMKMWDSTGTKKSFWCLMLFCYLYVHKFRIYINECDITSLSWLYYLHFLFGIVTL